MTFDHDMVCSLRANEVPRGYVPTAVGLYSHAVTLFVVAQCVLMIVSLLGLKAQELTLVETCSSPALLQVAHVDD